MKRTSAQTLPIACFMLCSFILGGALSCWPSSANEQRASTRTMIASHPRGTTTRTATASHPLGAATRTTATSHQHQQKASASDMIDPADLLATKATLDDRISDDLQAGRIDDHEATELHSDLDSIAVEESLFRADHNGTVTPQEERLLVTKYDRIKSRLDRQIGSLHHKNE